MRAATVLLFAALALPAAAAAQGRHEQPLPPETLDAVLTFFGIDTSVPLNAQVVDRGRALGFPREKLVFIGGRGGRVPAYLSYPESGRSPFPLVLLLHAGSSSKESWWQPDGYEYGAALTKSLLEAGYAVFALDAQGHGERAAGVDFVPIPALFYTNNWWAAFRTLAVETATDCRRALQYLGTRPEIDLTRLATVGQSLGALGSFYLAAVDPRVAVLVAGAPAVAESWLYPITGLNLAPAVRGRATLLLAGDHDQFASRERLAALRALLGPATEVREFPSDHRLPPAYVDASLNWIRRHLGR